MSKDNKSIIVFKKRVMLWADKIRVNPSRIRVQEMTHKWASCSPAGWVSFSKDLIKENGAFQDYVIVHELLHLKVPNHGKLFKSLFSTHFPQWHTFHHRNGSFPVCDKQLPE